MKDIPLKADNVGDTVDASEYNSATSEEKNAILTSGQVLSASDNFQLAKAMAIHASTGDFYLDSGSANNYILSPTGSRPTPPAYYDGMSVRFRAVAANTGASIVNVSSLGAKAIKQEDGGLDPTAGDIPAGKVSELVFNSSLNVFELTLGKYEDQVAITGTVDVGMYLSRPGWVRMDDGTIGDALSSATNRRNADCELLFKLIWTNVTSPWSNAYCPLVEGLGASAAADWAAHKQITLPRTLGRALCSAGIGAGLTARYLGVHLGQEGVAPSIDEITIHGHVQNGNTVHVLGVGNGSTDPAAGITPKISTETTGLGHAHLNMQPSSFFNIFMKL